MTDDINELLASVKPNSPLPKAEDSRAKLAAKLGKLQTSYKKAEGSGTLAFGEEFEIPDVISTGIPELDQNILVIGGIAKGRVIEIAGETNAGKSTLAWNIGREAIAQGLSVCVAENEGTFTGEYAEKVGMPGNMYHLLKGHALSGPQFLEEVMRLCEIGYDLIIVDSMFGIEGDAAAKARLTDMKMNTKQSGPQLVASFAKLWKNGWEPFLDEHKKLSVYKGIDSNTTLILINHLKKEFDGYGKNTGGSVDITYLYSQRIWLERLGMSADDVDENGDPIYTRVKISCRKSKLSPGGRSTFMCVDNRTGRFISDNKVIIDIAERKKVIERKGPWIKMHPDANYGLPALACLSPEMKWQGGQAFVDFCNEQPELLSHLLKFGSKNVRRDDSGKK